MFAAPEIHRTRIKVWNVAGAVQGKTALWSGGDTDIAILSEAPQNTVQLIGASGQWIGDSSNHGLAVVGMNGWQIERVPLHIEERLFLPVRATRGERVFYIVGVCAKRDGDYVRPTLRALSSLSDFILRMRPVVAGDFNQSASFDARRGPDRRFARVLDVMERLGMISAWHHHHRESFGNESSATYFHQWKRGQRFHIDYAFVPRQSQIKSIEIGSYSDYVDTKLSDHVPLFLELELSF